MNQQLSTLNLFVPKGKGRFVLVGVSAVMLVVLVGYAVVLASGPTVEQTGGAFLAANPDRHGGPKPGEVQTIYGYNWSADLPVLSTGF